jgi:hypothetical protein
MISGNSAILGGLLLLAAAAGLLWLGVRFCRRAPQDPVYLN